MRKCTFGYSFLYLFSFAMGSPSIFVINTLIVLDGVLEFLLSRCSGEAWTWRVLVLSFMGHETHWTCHRLLINSHNSEIDSFHAYILLLFYFKHAGIFQRMSIFCNFYILSKIMFVTGFYKYLTSKIMKVLDNVDNTVFNHWIL